MGKISARAGWAVAGALAVALLLVAAKVIQAGPLDPPGPVGSTMKTLADLAPSWHQTLTSNGCGSARWTCVLGNAAALDNETGLVWEKSPLWNGTDTWDNAQTLCTSDPAGGRYGWRLPTASELLTLKDSQTLDLVVGNPFTGVAEHAFWSSTSPPADAFRARYFTFSQFASNEQTALKADATVAGIWCVRGGRTDNPPVPDDQNGYSKVLSAQGNDPCTSERFTCVFSATAVLDHETGLVWLRNMGGGNRNTWTDAQSACFGLDYGGVRGWRLPSESELMSLMDPAPYPQNDAIPPGSPFTVTSSFIATTWWSSTEVRGTANAYAVRFKEQFQQSPGMLVEGKTDFIYYTCVRGIGPP